MPCPEQLWFSPSDLRMPKQHCERDERRRHDHPETDSYPGLEPDRLLQPAESGGERERGERPADQRCVGRVTLVTDEPERQRAREGHEREAREAAGNCERPDRPAEQVEIEQAA